MSVAELGHVGAEAIFGSFGVRANADRGGGGDLAILWSHLVLGFRYCAYCKLCTS